MKLGDRRRVETLFERAAAMDLPPKKMKVCAWCHPKHHCCGLCARVTSPWTAHGNALRTVRIRLYHEVLPLCKTQATCLTGLVCRPQFFFKRWSDYEENLGDAAAVERVKQLATEYIESRQMDA